MGREAGVKAAVYTRPGRLQLGDWPEPRIGPGELLVRVRGCGLCGSDLARLRTEAGPTPDATASAPPQLVSAPS